MGYNSREEYFQRVRKAKERARRGQIGAHETRAERVQEERIYPEPYSSKLEIKVDERSSREEFSGRNKNNICEELRNNGKKGNGKKRELNERIWNLWKGYNGELNEKEVASELGTSTRTVRRHLNQYGNMKYGGKKKDYM